mmetsp:Transcript_22500/g.70607  ORF Transcript_22500/g.70607 Transcript_22500/m.70607 type:complete len:241 (+) Transcript_22500:522-1244(+)
MGIGSIQDITARRAMKTSENVEHTMKAVVKRVEHYINQNMKGAGGVTACYRESAMNFATTHAKILTDEVKLERPRDHRFRHAASIDDQQNLHDKSTNAAPAPAAFTNTLGLLSLSVAPASKTSSLTSCSRLATAPPPRGTAAPRVPVVPLSVTRAENRAILLERLKKRPAVPQVGPVTPTPAPAPALSRQTAMAGVAPSPLTLVAHLSAPTSLSPQPMPLTLALSTPVAESAWPVRCPPT